MKRKLLLLISISVLLLTSSCSLYSWASLSNAKIGDKCYLNMVIFQAFNSHEALATSNDNNNIIVKLLTAEDTFYDGKRISGMYIMVDTYTYENKLQTTKTVPVFIKESEYNATKPLQEKEPERQKF